MSAKKHLVHLSADERAALQKVSASNHHSGRVKTRARILVGSDLNTSREEGGSRTDAELALEFKVSLPTVASVRQRAHERGVIQSLERAEQTNRKARKLDGHQEAQLVALTCSTPPEGCSRWSLVLLREKMIEMEIVEQIGLETIRSTLKKTRSSLG
jgi:hypothetical protein